MTLVRPLPTTLTPSRRAPPKCTAVSLQRSTLYNFYIFCSDVSAGTHSPAQPSWPSLDIIKEDLGLSSASRC